MNTLSYNSNINHKSYDNSKTIEKWRRKAIGATIIKDDYASQFPNTGSYDLPRRVFLWGSKVG
jgi:hypothetical protein